MTDLLLPAAQARALPRLAGVRVLVLNWRDVRHSQAGGAEAYAHEISRRWVAAGARVTWLTARDAGQAARDSIDGIEIRRAGGTLSVYAHAALQLVREGRDFDVVLDCQNGIPFFSPLFTLGGVPVVQLVHHVHQDQFATRFSRGGAALGRLLEGPVSRRVYARRRTVAVSPSTRHELRSRLRLDGVVEVVPNGCLPSDRDTGPVRRAPHPTVAVVSRLVPHKRVDLLLQAVARARREVPHLRLDVVGDGPELDRLRHMAVELGLGAAVTFHGRRPDAVRDEILRSAWLTTSTSQGEGWGCSILEAAALGVPCLALQAPGVRDSVVHGRTGWLVEDAGDLAAALVRAVGELSSPGHAEQVAEVCRRWARYFDWDRSAELLAAVVLAEIATGRLPRDLRRARTRRTARSDISTVVRAQHDRPEELVRGLRLTDEVTVSGSGVTAILRGCDEVGALSSLQRLHARDAQARLATRHELLAGPALVDDEPPGTP